MASIKQNTAIKECQNFVGEVYGPSNDRYFSLGDMIINMERFMMRGLKGIRKKDSVKIKNNLLISLSWFMSIMNQLHIDIEEKVWKRFPFLCSYCGSCPCSCAEIKMQNRRAVPEDENKRPKTFENFQDMFNKIYPAQKRTLEHAGVHLAEEIGEFSEAILAYRGAHEDKDFKNIELEAADLFSCMMGVFNSLDINIAKELSLMFADNCHVCHNAPCTCDFKNITNFKS
jgi:NTP pyrophosphatase (non-canonical NTP hydrolase)